MSLVPAVWAGPQIVGFDDAAEGRLPAGWVSELTHVGGPPRWEVVRDKTAPSAPKVLAQLSVDATSARYPLAILDGVRMTDGKVSVRFRPVSGKEDQAAGIAFRLQDRDNYYIVRANALENNVVLYKVENGKRTALAPTGMPSGTYGVKHPVPGGVWSTLSVEFRGGRLQVAMSGAALFEVEDSTFLRSGRIGLWTKADSVTHFDDFAYEPSASHSN
ncbi:MAG: hypothetical protein NTY38_32445 [Acidobacteria bacterium]|nr:hypothetical protein [Acidobacteriota bacterium]